MRVSAFFWGEAFAEDLSTTVKEGNKRIKKGKDKGVRNVKKNK